MWENGSEAVRRTVALVEASELNEAHVREALALYAQLDEDSSSSAEDLYRQQFLRVLVSYHAWAAPGAPPRPPRAIGNMMALPAKALTGVPGPALLLCSSKEALARGVQPLLENLPPESIPQMEGLVVAGANAIVEFLDGADPDKGAAIAFYAEADKDDFEGAGTVMAGASAAQLGDWARCLLLELELGRWHRAGAGSQDPPFELVHALMQCNEVHVVQKDGGIVGVPSGHLLVLTSPDAAAAMKAFQGETTEVSRTTPAKLCEMVASAGLPGLAFSLGKVSSTAGEEPPLAVATLDAPAISAARRRWATWLEQRQASAPPMKEETPTPMKKETPMPATPPPPPRK